MKNERGVTLISLTIYLIVMAIIIGVLSIIATFFYKNTKGIREISPIAEYTKFNSFFTKEVNERGITIVNCENSESKDYNYIEFNTENGLVKYTFIKANKGIYRNNVKICRGIVQCEFEIGTSAETGEETIKVKILAQNDRNVKEPVTYTIKE